MRAAIVRTTRAYRSKRSPKAQVSFRVRQALREELAAFAAQEKRTLGNLGELILEWRFEQLKPVGSKNRVLKSKVHTIQRAQKPA